MSDLDAIISGHADAIESGDSNSSDVDTSSNDTIQDTQTDDNHSADNSTEVIANTAVANTAVANTSVANTAVANTVSANVVTANTTTANTADPVDTELEALGIKKNNRLPYDRVKAIFKNQQKKLTDAHTAEVSTYQQQLQNVAELNRIVATEPERFIEILKDKYPAYRNYFVAPNGANVSTQSTTTADAGMPQKPQPTVELPNGQMTYDADGFEKLAEWKTQVKEYEAQQKAKREEAVIQSAHTIVTQQLADVATWEGMTEENQKLMGAAMKADPNLSLEGAYRKIVVPKLKVDKNKLREELLAEIQNQPHSTSIAANPTRVGQDGEVSLDDKLMAHAERLANGR
jgi:hypothetical protein